MRLCEHLMPIYQEELKMGNEVLAVGLNFDTGLKMSIFFKKIPMLRNISKSIEEGYTNLPHYPKEHWFACNACKMLLSFPMNNDQPDTYAPVPWAKPNDKVVVTKETVYADDQLSDWSIRPTIRY